MIPPGDVVRKLKDALDQLDRADRRALDNAESEFDRALSHVRTLPRDGILEALDKAVGKSKRRQRASVYILGELADIPAAVERLERLLQQPDWRARHWVIQTIGHHRLTKCAESLNSVMLRDPQELCRRAAVEAASRIQASVNWPAILALAESGDLEDSVVSALTRYGREEGRPYLRRVFERPLPETPSVSEIVNVNRARATDKVDKWSASKSDKVFAAWGLAKLGELDAVEFLGEMLDDPDVVGPNCCHHGESMRAAQALADVYNVPFEWSKDDVPFVRQWWAKNKDRILHED